jgi:hypothetical protein
MDQKIIGARAALLLFFQSMAHRIFLRGPETAKRDARLLLTTLTPNRIRVAAFEMTVLH